MLCDVLEDECDEGVGGIHVGDDQVSVSIQDLWMCERLRGYSEEVIFGDLNCQRVPTRLDERTL